MDFGSLKFGIYLLLISPGIRLAVVFKRRVARDFVLRDYTLAFIAWITFADAPFCSMIPLCSDRFDLPKSCVYFTIGLYLLATVIV
jgi:hypothetical protein